MVTQGTIGRFARWGLTHGPVWGTLAGALAGIPLANVLNLSWPFVGFVILGAVAGLALGPVLAVCVGATCMAAEHVPRWLLDAPDYVAVITVVGLVGAAAWPLLQVMGASTALTVLGIVLIAAAPTIDAARSAPLLLHPSPRSAQPR